MNIGGFSGSGGRAPAAGVLLLAAALGLSGPPAAPRGHFLRTDLVSDPAGVAPARDRNLINPWGLAKSPSGPWRVADKGSGVVTAYTGEGAAYPPLRPLAVTVPPPPGVFGPSVPDAAVFNGSGDFTIAADKPARWIFTTEDGTIAGWNPAVDADRAVITVDNSSWAVYKGAALGRVNGAAYLYAANFLAGSVDVFDTFYNQVSLSAGAFDDPGLSGGYAPYNVENINGRLYVAYAERDVNSYDALRGDGLGYVSVFDLKGKLLSRLEHGPWLNAPWGMALAPGGFGAYGGCVLVGNAGSGTIAAFDPRTGAFKGLLEGKDGTLVTIQGLHGLGFGNGGLAGPPTVLYFTASLAGENYGLFGSLKPAD